METVKPLLNLRNNSCRAVSTISGELDNYISAHTFFNKACTAGKDAGCFHLALLENERGDLRLAMEIMEPLCDRKYIIHENVWSSACNEYERMKQAWKVQNPRQPRDDAIQLSILGATLVLPLIAAGFLLLRRYYLSLSLSVLAFISYGHYEYGVSPYANIRIDLLAIYPLLLVSLAVCLASAALLFKTKSKLDNNPE